VVVAKLPFKPIGIFRNLTHHNLDGEDYSLCSVAFLYILALLSLRNSIRKFIGFKRPRTREPITLTFPTKLLLPKDGKFNDWW
jgi:hypothetical protein